MSETWVDGGLLSFRHYSKRNLREPVPRVKIACMEHKKWFRQHFIFLAIQVIIAGWVAFMWFHLPAPGWGVAILAGVAAAMSIHGDMRGWQKAVWMLLIGLLLIVELRAISKDRADADARALEDRKAQDTAFKSVRDAQDLDFKATAGGLSTAIDGIKSTLKTSDTTLLQTRPHAVIRFDRMEFSGTSPAQIKSNVEYTFNIHYINDGTETASNIQSLPELFIAPFDDKNAQIELIRKFEKDWENRSLRYSFPSVLVPATPSFGSTKRTFTDEEMRNLTPGGTIYLLMRFEYTDETGRWRTDECEAFQRTSPAAEIQTNIFHTCSVFQRFRYPVNQRR